MPARPPARQPAGRDTRAQLFQQARLWGMSLICAVVGTVAIVRTNSLLIGIYAFLLSLVILGPLLYLYEKRRKNRSQ